MKAPFPWFGGKSRVAGMVWDRFGDVRNYVEPFAGSLAVLLGRPPFDPDAKPSRLETVNDADCYVVNFWRAVKADPDGVKEWTLDPPREADLVARNNQLVKIRESIRQRCFEDPDYYSVKLAGWWAWTLAWWIGSGAANQTVSRKMPALSGVTRGIQGDKVDLNALSQRLSRTRVACGDWTRVCTPAITYRLGLTGILLDPPYAGTDVYRDADSISVEVGRWALANGDNPKLRIAVCGYEGEHDLPGWTCIPWKANGGYGNRTHGTGRENATRERIWFSPHCLDPEKPHACVSKAHEPARTGRARRAARRPAS